MKPIPLVRQVTYAPAIAFLTSQGIPVQRYLRKVKLAMPQPETLEILVPVQQVCEFFCSVSRGEGFVDLGFRLCGQQGCEHLGTYGRLLSESLTIHDLIQRSMEYVSSYNSGLRIWLERHGDQVRYCQKFDESLPRDQITEAVHFGLASAMATSPHAQGVNWRPSRIELASSPIELSAYFPNVADLPLAFDQPHTSIWFDRKMLSTPLPRPDASRQATVPPNERADWLAKAPAADPLDQLEQVIESALSHPEMGLPFTAKVIGISVRTLQRRLTEQCTSFSHLHQRAQFRHALELLRDPSLPLMQIGRQLGYTDSANFIRAFKRWTGVGPNEYRRMHYHHGSKQELTG